MYKTYIIIIINQKEKTYHFNKRSSMATFFPIVKIEDRQKCMIVTKTFIV